MKPLAILADTLMRATMWALLPMGPVAAALIARDADYLRHYPRSLRASAAHLRAMRRARPIARAIERRLDSDAVREEISGSCSHCGRCCLDKACVFLRYGEDGGSRCQIYGSWFWQQLACGGYPVSHREIALYACPSFTTTNRRVIPIKSVPASSERPREVSQTA